jgi:hypothetical protein
VDFSLVPERLKNELNTCCKRIVEILRIKKGSIEIHCHKGVPKQVDVHDKSIKFNDQT